tara:strand:- start:17 stop:265 length:249 start_codon:yes stop_codon:yes gene_type:complete
MKTRVNWRTAFHVLIDREIAELKTLDDIDAFDERHQDTVMTSHQIARINEIEARLITEDIKANAVIYRRIQNASWDGKYRPF